VSLRRKKGVLTQTSTAEDAKGNIRPAVTIIGLSSIEKHPALTYRSLGDKDKEDISADSEDTLDDKKSDEVSSEDCLWVENVCNTLQNLQGHHRDGGERFVKQNNSLYGGTHL
jgi:hypothetical protein